MKENLNQLNFGEMDVNAGNIDSFWLTGASNISAFQQIDFLKKLYNNELPISKSTHALMKNIMRIEQKEDFILSGKTGLAILDEHKVGWFVGYIEKKEAVFFFATRIHPTKNEMSTNAFASIRKSVTIAALKGLDIIK